MSSLLNALGPAPFKSERKAEDDTEMLDLFGNEGHHEDARVDDEEERLSSPERERRRALEYEEEDIPAELAVEVKEAQVSFPNIPLPRSSSDETWVIRMPNFVTVDTKPFHPDSYEAEGDEGQTESHRESMSIKLKVDNTVRWRWTKDELGNDQRQSNSRIIRWSDGTLSLRLGKELFDIHQSIDTSGAIPRQSFGTQNSQQSASPMTPARSSGLTYLVAQHKRSQVLQAEALITGLMTLRPTGMQSETHRMLVKAVGQKHNKVARLRMAPDPLTDPEKEIRELAKQNAKKAKRKVHDFDDGLGGRSRRKHRRQAAQDFTDDEDGDAVFDGPSSDEEDLARSSSRGAKSKTKSALDDKKGDYQEDGFVVADGDDAGSDAGGEDVDVMEDLEKMDAQLDARQRRSRSKPDGDEATDDVDAEADDGMEVESEEEDEDDRIRRASKSRTRKRQIYDEEDEE